MDGSGRTCPSRFALHGQYEPQVQELKTHTDLLVNNCGTKGRESDHTHQCRSYRLMGNCCGGTEQGIGDTGSLKRRNVRASVIDRIDHQVNMGFGRLSQQAEQRESRAVESSGSASVSRTIAAQPGSQPEHFAELFELVTWNVWFGKLARALRRECLLTEATATSPAVLCFQEVTPYFHTAMAQHPGISGKYRCAVPPVEGYDVTIWLRSDVELERTHVTDIPSVLGLNLSSVYNYVPARS